MIIEFYEDQIETEKYMIKKCELDIVLHKGDYIGFDGKKAIVRKVYFDLDHNRIKIALGYIDRI